MAHPRSMWPTGCAATAPPLVRRWYEGPMATFALVHGACDVGWSWHLVEAHLRERGHEVVAPDLPCDDPTATLLDHADAVVEAVGARQDVVVVGHSYGGMTATLVADRLPADLLVYVAAMVPAPGERPSEWWDHTGYEAAVAAQAARDGVRHDPEGDPFATSYHDVPRALAEEGLRRERGESPAAAETPFPLAALPDVPTRFVVCTEDRFFPAPFLRRVAVERLGIEPDKLAAGHCAALAQPARLAELLDGYLHKPMR